MIVAPSSFELTRTDGTKLHIDLEPVTGHEERSYVFTGVYQLRATESKRSGESTLDIGAFAHKQDDKYEWEYLGNYLDEDEQARIADHIQQLEDSDESPASFYVEAFYHGGMSSFEVSAKEAGYTVAYDGAIIAELQHHSEWEQTSGELLEEDVFVSIKQAIEGKFKS